MVSWADEKLVAFHMPRMSWVELESTLCGLAKTLGSSKMQKVKKQMRQDAPLLFSALELLESGKTRHMARRQAQQDLKQVVDGLEEGKKSVAEVIGALGILGKRFDFLANPLAIYLNRCLDDLGFGGQHGLRVVLGNDRVDLIEAVHAGCYEDATCVRKSIYGLYVIPLGPKVSDFLREFQSGLYPGLTADLSSD